MNMMYKILFMLMLMCLVLPSMKGNEKVPYAMQAEKKMNPKYLYKILSVEDWRASQDMKSVKLGMHDEEFIHLSREDQLDRIVEKYWGDIPEFVVLKIEVKKLMGNLVLEANPGGMHKYYHLYEGSIPMKAVVEAKIIKNCR